MSRKIKWSLGLAATFVIAVLVARAVAPIYILGYVNKTLDGLDGYKGRVADIDLHIWRGAYEIKGIKIEKTTRETTIPFVAIDSVDISLHWDALFKGAIVGEIDLYRPQLNFLAEKKKSKAEDQVEQREAKRAAEGESSWQTQVKELVPLDINRIGIHDGEIHYRDPQAQPKVDVYVQQFRGQLTNLTNSDELNEDMVATAAFRGLVLGSGDLTLDAKVDPYQESPTFDLQTKLENLQVRELNDFLKAYANIDAEKGRISVYTEVSAAEGRFKGYLKPMIRDLDVLRWKDEDEGFFGKLWEGIVGAGAQIFENQNKDQIATKIPFSGKLENPTADIGTTVLYVIRNAWIKALQFGLEQSAGGGEGSFAQRGKED
jgi:uncharacterized protein involved in outer membrane biogenesis